ncbi:MAG: hypothetical protein MJ230_00565 [bacterium]|nr:hypothetical protein [bacterium]
MNIESVKPFTIKSYNNKNYKFQNNSPTFRAGYIGDIFIKGNLPIDKLKRFTINEYRQLSKSEIASINAMIDGIIQNKTWKDASENIFFDNAHHLFTDYTSTWSKFDEYLEGHNIVTTDMKDKLEKKYGADNFVVISIGRSLSSICKCLGYKIGEENVIQLPMSEARRFCHNIEKIKQSGIDALTDYLASFGMTKEAVQNSGKKYIFTDYRCRGGTMAGAKTLFKSNRMFGNTDNIIFVDIINMMPDYYGTWLSQALGNMDYKDLSLVNMCDNLFRTTKSVYKPEDWDLLLKSFYFKFMHSKVSDL